MRAVVVTTVLAAALAAPTIARADEPCELNRLDCLAVTQFSATADATSDALFVASLALPIALELGRGLDDDSLRRGGAYAASVGATALTAGLVKITVQRDRPYTYHRHPSVVAYTAAAHGNDHSFFSGHTSLSFAALTSGAMLYQPTTTSARARAGVWAGAGALGAATGVLRIRAGQHFPTDVMVGAAVGTAFGIGLTYALAPGEPTLDGTDLGMFAAGVAVGAIAAAVVPMPSDVRLPLGVRSLAVTPTLGADGAGLAILATR